MSRKGAQKGAGPGRAAGTGKGGSSTEKASVATRDRRILVPNKDVPSIRHRSAVPTSKPPRDPSTGSSRASRRNRAAGAGTHTRCKADAADPDDFSQPLADNRRDPRSETLVGRARSKSSPELPFQTSARSPGRP